MGIRHRAFLGGNTRRCAYCCSRPKELFPFPHRDELTGKWVRARYLAERHEINE